MNTSPRTAHLVTTLRAAGFQVPDDGDDETDERPYLTVVMLGTIEDARRLVDTLTRWGVELLPIVDAFEGATLKGPCIQVTWDPASSDPAMIDLMGLDDVMLLAAIPPVRSMKEDRDFVLMRMKEALDLPTKEDAKDLWEEAVGAAVRRLPGAVWVSLAFCVDDCPEAVRGFLKDAPPGSGGVVCLPVDDFVRVTEGNPIFQGTRDTMLAEPREGAGWVWTVIVGRYGPERQVTTTLFQIPADSLAAIAENS